MNAVAAAMICLARSSRIAVRANTFLTRLSPASDGDCCAVCGPRGGHHPLTEPQSWLSASNATGGVDYPLRFAIIEPRVPTALRSAMAVSTRNLCCRR